MTDDQNSNNKEMMEENIMNVTHNEVPSPKLNDDQKSVGKNYYFAGFWMRFWAYLLDLIIVGSLHRIIIKPIFRIVDIPLSDEGMFSPFAIATAITFYLYFIILTKYFSATIGKMVFGLRVVSLKESRLSWSTIIFREGIGRYISAFTNILYILVAFTPNKQGLHDIFADTSVIHERSLKQLQSKPA